MSMRLWRIFEVLTRKKPIEDPSESKLAKVLSAFDLTALGIGSTLGVGVYVLAGQVARESAGPAVIISFIIAAIASVFAGLCYAEFGARVPKAGSAYIYSYVTIGEFIAFIIGWNLILEYAIGSASVVKGLSHYLDKLFDNAMRNYLNETIPMHIDGLAPYPDLFAFSATMLFSWAIAVGAKESTIVNNVFTGLNLCVVLFVIIAGLFKVDLKNWRIPESEVPHKKYGRGGFFPYGFSGIIRGAATCFYGFIGFDCIATAGEEAKNPRKSIPFAVITSLAMIFLAYFGISTVLTLMLPYYEQDKEAPLPHVFKIYGWYVAEKIVSVGATFGLCASLMGAMFPLPRIVFAMSSDGLLYKFMGEISTKYKTPFNGTLLTGLLTGILAAIFNLDQLVEMMSIGTLLAYSMVAGCVVILRYEFDEKTKHSKGHLLSENGSNRAYRKKNTTFIGKLLNTNHIKSPTKFSAKIVTISVSLFSLWCFFLSMSLIKFEDNVNNITFADTSLAILASIPVIISLVIIHRQPVSNSELSFKVPFLPWLPGISIFINIYLMIRLDIKTWIRFIIWIVIGLIIYFSYGIRRSNERKRELARIATRNSETENDNKAEVPLIYVSNNSNSNSNSNSMVSF